MSLPLVSIVIPAYGRPDFLPEAIASCKAQDYAGPTEIIVVDDGSPQDIRGVVERTHPDVQYVRIENAGSATARQTGADLARGEYIAYNDDDDLWEPHKLGLQIALMEAHPEIDWCIADYNKFSTKQTYTRTNFADHNELWNFPHKRISDSPPAFLWEPQAYTGAILMGGPFPPQTTVVRKAFIAKAGGWDKRIRDNGQDVEFGLRASWVGRVAFIDMPLARVRRHHGSNISHDVTRAYTIVLRNIANAAREYQPGLKEFVRARLGDYYARVGWMLMRDRQFPRATWHYHQALEFGKRNAAVRLRHVWCKLRSKGAEEPPPCPRK